MGSVRQKMNQKQRLITYFPLLEAIVAIKDKKIQKLVLKHMRRHRPFVILLRELAENTVNQNIKLTLEQKRKLNKVTAVVKSLTKKKNTEQAGGFLGILVPILAAEVASLVAGRNG